MAYGYRIDEIILPEIKPPKAGVLVKRIQVRERPKNPCMCSLGPVVPTAVQPHPDQYDTATTLAGILKRAASKHPEPDQQKLQRLKEFVKNWLEKNLVPLPPDSDTSIERWLEHCNYPLWRKEELTEKHKNIQNRLSRLWWKAKCFIKNETYPLPKHARAIYSRTDEYKTIVGPIFKLIEEQVYKLPYFVKHIPVADRPKYICEYLNTRGKAAATDYTSFESVFTPEIMLAVELQLYHYMSQFVDRYAEFSFHLQALTEDQDCVFRDVTVELPSCRLSGDMCTSLGNGFSNLMFALFILSEQGCTDVRIVVEGDDGLMTYNGPRVGSAEFAQLGLTIKLDEHDRIETASFCGIIFDQEELINIDDPRDAIATLGWGDAQYSLAKKSKKRSLLRCKSLSLAHQYPGCPIISELAQYGLRVTRGHDIRFLGANTRNTWYRDQLLNAIKDEKRIPVLEPGPRSRALVEEMYGIKIEWQFKIEEYLRNKTDDSPINCPYIDMIMPDEWREYADEYVRYVSKPTLKEQKFTSDGKNHISSLLELEGVTLSPKAFVTGVKVLQREVPLYTRRDHHGSKGLKTTRRD